MFAIVVSLALFAFTVAMLVQMAQLDGAKVLAALKGNSWTANPPAAVRSVTVRFSQRYPASRPMRIRPELRAAA